MTFIITIRQCLIPEYAQTSANISRLVSKYYYDLTKQIRGKILPSYIIISVDSTPDGDLCYNFEIEHLPLSMSLINLTRQIQLKLTNFEVGLTGNIGYKYYIIVILQDADKVQSHITAIGKVPPLAIRTVTKDNRSLKFITFHVKSAPNQLKIDIDWNSSIQIPLWVLALIIPHTFEIICGRSAEDLCMHDSGKYFNENGIEMCINNSITFNWSGIISEASMNNFVLELKRELTAIVINDYVKK